MSRHALPNSAFFSLLVAASLMVAPHALAQTSAATENPTVVQSGPWATPTLALAQTVIRERHPNFRQRDVPGRHSVLTLVLNARGQVERSALIENEQATRPVAASMDFLSTQFPESGWSFEAFRRAGTAIFKVNALSPDPS
jgi:hypothetical protein